MNNHTKTLYWYRRTFSIVTILRFQVTTVKHVKGLLNRMMLYTVIKTLIIFTLNLINLPLVRPSKGDEMGEASSMGRRNAYEIRVANCQYK
jgi:hypothetical protein